MLTHPFSKTKLLESLDLIELATEERILKNWFYIKNKAERRLPVFRLFNAPNGNVGSKWPSEPLVTLVVA